jgi:hypothetical protein
VNSPTVDIALDEWVMEQEILLAVVIEIDQPRILLIGGHDGRQGLRALGKDLWSRYAWINLQSSEGGLE